MLFYPFSSQKAGVGRGGTRYMPQPPSLDPFPGLRRVKRKLTHVSENGMELQVHRNIFRGFFWPNFKNPRKYFFV